MASDAVMEPRPPHTTLASPSGARRLRAGLALLAALAATHGLAQAPAAAPPAAATAPAADQLEKLVAPIALYPDDLIAIVLPASTQPLQLVQADRFLEKRKADPKLALDEKWDAAVKSLLNYPEVVKTMSGDLDWTSALGEAVVADQADVLEAIQAFRRKTLGAGHLKSDAHQVVVVEKEVIKIVPADPQVIYVPQYNPGTVVVAGAPSAWGYYPSPYPVYYYPYPPGAALAAGLIWGAAIGAAWDGGRYVTHYDGNVNINIDRDLDIHRGSVNVNPTGPVSARPTTTRTTAWQPTKTPGQVAGTTAVKPTTPRVGDARGDAAPRAAPSAGTSAGTSAGARAGASVARAQPGVAAQGNAAFDGYGSRRQTQLDSARGAASRRAAKR